MIYAAFLIEYCCEPGNIPSHSPHFYGRIHGMNPFKELPGNFFVPLSFGNREHYAALLLAYYELFLEYHSGIERAQVVSVFEAYFAGLGNAAGVIADEEENAAKEDVRPETRDEPEAASPRGLALLFLRRLVNYRWSVFCPPPASELKFFQFFHFFSNNMCYYLYLNIN
jgi:hypothetical protein